MKGLCERYLASDRFMAAREATRHQFSRIVRIAWRHRRRRWVFNLDLEDFFPSINFGRVRGFLLKNRDFELHADVATVIAQIACHDNSLPQGSPCSPVISNLVAHLLDMRLVKLGSESGCTYSRYADDLTFSTNKKEFPAAIAVPSGTEGDAAHVWVPGEALRKIVERTGFRINPKKTCLMYRGARQEVTGLVTNAKISVRWEYRHNVRAMVHGLVKTGEFEILGAKQQNGQPALEMRPGTPDELHGMLGFIDSIDVYNRTHTSGWAAHGMSSREKTYREFLMYSDFYAAPAPVIICEGETDNIYLTHAIRSLVAEFPDLAEVLPDKKIRLKVRLYKYPHSSTARLLGLMDGGSSVLGKFIAAYKKETKKFTGPGLTSPVVIVYDHDQGAGSVRSAIKEAAKVVVTDGDPFVHVIKNMYAVHTPGANPSKIEDVFDAATKATLVDGKSFNDGNDFDAARHYGKKVFAHKVVRAKADSLNFEGFRPLLTNIVAAILKHKASNPPQMGA